MSTIETPAPRWQRVDDPGFWPAWQLARKRMDAEPRMLTEDDLGALAMLDPAAAEHGRRLRAAAIEAGVPTPAPAATRPSKPAPTLPRDVARLPCVTAEEEKSLETEEGFEAYVKKNADKAVPLQVWWEYFKAARGKRRDLEARVHALEARPTLRYLGVWKAETSYPEGSAVTHQGGVWISRRPTSQRPDADGPGEHDWQLAVKRGADGRDAR